MAEAKSPIAVTSATAAERLFPTLSAAQIARIEAHGRRRPITRGEVLIEVGDKVVPFYVLVAGAVEILRPSASGETLIVTHHAGGFLGEGNMIAGRRALARARVSLDGEVIALDHRQLLTLVQTDAELSEILMRAFILRRVELIAHGFGDVVVLGSMHCAGHAAGQGVPDAQWPPLRLHRPRPRRRGAGDARSLPRQRGRRAGAHLPRRRRAAQPEQPADRRVPRLQRRDRSHAHARRGDRRRRPLGARRRGLRRVRGARRPGRGVAGPGRAGGVELAHRELPRFPHRHFRAGADGPGLRAGAEVRRRDPDREGSDRAGVRRPAVRRAHRRATCACPRARW